MWPVPEVVSCCGLSGEKVTLYTSWEKALLLNNTFSLAQSQMVSMKSGSPPTDASRLPSPGVKFI